MRTLPRHILFLICPFVILVFLTNCQGSLMEDVEKEKVEGIKTADLDEIITRNKLIVLAENSAISYFIYRGQAMGLEYEILREFAREIGVELEVQIINDIEEAFAKLKQGEGDLIACNLAITKERKREISFSTSIMNTMQVLVQRKPDNWRKVSKRRWKNELVRYPDELLGKTVYVWENSSYYNRLVNLQKELGDTIYIKSIKGDFTAEKAMELVDKGEIEYTVVDKNAARVSMRYFPNIDFETHLSLNQRIAFGIRKKSPKLEERLNVWLDKFKKTATYSHILHKYLNTSVYSNRAKSGFSSISGSKISPFDDIIKEKSDKYGWDWRVVASLIYQESKFQLYEESHVGAYGLMQFMPGIGPHYDVFPDSSPEVQIEGGLKKLAQDYMQWKNISDSIQRLKFTLASYNAGVGHVLDAQRLTEKYGKNPLIWDGNVELYMSKLEDPKYYHDSVSRHGYVRGSETYRFVREIFIRYNEYKGVFSP